MAFALRIEDDVVFAVLDGVFLAVAGVKVRGVFGDILFYPVDVVIEQADWLLALVDDFDSGRLAKRHVPEAIIGIGVLDDDRQTTVPVHPKEHLLMICRAVLCPGVRLRTKEGHPDVGDHTGSFGVHQNLCLAGRDGLVVVVAVGIGLAVWVVLSVGIRFVRGGFAHTSARLRAGQVAQGVGEKALGQR